MRLNGGVNRACKIAGVLAVAIVLAACSRNQLPPKEYGVGSVNSAAPGTAQDFTSNVGDVVRFEVDSSSLTGEAQGILQKQAVWLNQYPQYTVTIEGHADERGTREYNISLSARRATASRNFLISQGVDGGRVSSIAYGKERPAELCDAEECWSKNRRTVTVITGGTN